MYQQAHQPDVHPLSALGHGAFVLSELACGDRDGDVERCRHGSDGDQRWHDQPTIERERPDDGGEVGHHEEDEDRGMPDVGADVEVAVVCLPAEGDQAVDDPHCLPQVDQAPDGERITGRADFNEESFRGFIHVVGE